MVRIKNIPNISNRLLSVCNFYSFSFIEDLIEYKFENGNFNSLRNCGQKTIAEINLLISNIDKFDHVKETRISNDSLLSYIELNKYKLSARAKNILEELECKVKGNRISIQDLTSRNFLYSIPKVGNRTVKELYNLFSDYESYDSEDVPVNQVLYLRELLNNSDIEHEYLQQLYNVYEVSSIFELDLVSILITSITSRIKRRSLNIWYEYYDLNLPLGEISSKLDISRERVRQIKNKLVSESKSICNILVDIFKAFHHNPSLDIKGDFIMALEYKLVHKVSIEFLFSCIANLTEFELVISNKPIRVPFLIRRFEGLLIRELFLEIDRIASLEYEKDTLISILDLINRFSSNITVNLKLFKNVLKRVIDEVYKIEILDDKLLLKRTTYVKDYERIVSILEEAQKPLHIDLICKELIVRGIKKEGYKSENIRSHMLNYPEVFIFTSWSTYGLKIWEKQKNLVGGTIKNLVENYLSQFESPKHIFDITKYILNHRDTNLESIRGIITLDPHNIFIVFNAGFIGLKNKEYTFSDTNYRNVSNRWFQIYQDKYVMNDISLYPINILQQKLSNDLNVKPIQIEDVLQNRIDDKQLFVDSDNYLHNSLASLEDQKISLTKLEQVKLSKFKREISNLDLIAKCIELLAKRNVQIGIKKAKVLLENI